jgi:hypothetical protein
MNATQSPKTTFTIREAAVRVARSVRTIEQWVADGDLDVLNIRNPSGRVIERRIDEEDLLNALHGKLAGRVKV